MIIHKELNVRIQTSNALHIQFYVIILAHDRSGFRIHYTEKVRTNDGGIMITGVSISDTQLIPPGQKLYRNVGICGPSCTNVV